MQNGNDNLNFYKVWICYLAFFIAGSQFFVVLLKSSEKTSINFIPECLFISPNLRGKACKIVVYPEMRL